MAAQDAELKLKVSLDLAFFRQQLSGLGQAAAGYNIPIKFDRQKINAELNNLQRAINRRTYRIEIGGNLGELPKQIQKLKDQLSSLEDININVGVGAIKSLSKRDAQRIKRELRAGILGEDKKIFVPVSITPSITNADVADFKRAVKEKLSGISVKVKTDVSGAGFAGTPQGAAGFMEYMRSEGLLGKTASGMEMRMRNEGGGRIQRSALDQLARAIFFMAGVDPSQIRERARRNRTIPEINWPSQVPPRRSMPGGRLLTGSPPMAGLPGSAYANQKRLIGDILSPSLKEILRGAANTFADAVRNELNRAVRSVQVRDLGRVGRAMLPGTRIAGLLSPEPPGRYRVGRAEETQAELFARREREARMRSALREIDVMGGGAGRPPSPYSYAYRGARPLSAMVPYTAGGALVPTGGGGGGLPPRRPPGGAGGLGGFGRALGSVQLPGTGVVREIGEEFAMATKQVLLYGTVYKALGALTSFPAQVGQAVGALQSFNNTLKAISPTAQEARASTEFILDIVDRYNVPLQSARDGFTKLYASMAPAGFKGDEIRALFTGVSQAAATFGMSAEKVDRVNYAFAQMASKGQVMSEELKGQLGDVLPGAMGIFAEAAGFKGKDAIEKFSKALEDGVYKGDAMRALLKNVTGVLQRDFGPGAEGAARTFQGVINRMQNSTKLLYEAFEPVAVGFLNAVVVPMTNGIKTLSDGFNAFFKGQAAETIGGGAVAQQLNDLKPAFEGILANIKALIPSFQIFGAAVFNAVKLLTAFAGNPIVGFLFTVYTNVLLVNTAFKLLGGQILVGLVASINTAIVRIVALGYAVNALGVQTTGARTALAGTQLQMLLLQRSAAGMVGPLTLSNLAMAALAGKAALVVGGLVLLGKGVYDTNETFRNFVNNIGGVVASDFRDAVDGMAKDAGNSADNIEKSYKDLTTKLNPIGQFIKQLFRDVFKDTSDSAQASATQSTNSFNEFFNSLSINAAAGFNGLSAVISQWWANLPAPIRRIFEGNAVSTLIGAGQYAVGAANRAAAPNAQATGMFGKYIPGSAQTKIPTTRKSATTTPINAVVGGDGTGGGAKGGKGRESQAALLKLEVEYNKELMSLESQIFSAQLGENTLLVTRLEGERELLKLKYELAKVNLEEISAEDKKLKIQAIGQQAELVRLKVRSSMEGEITRAINEQQKAVEELQVASQLEVNNKKMYADLLEKGIAPAQAKILIEVDNEINKIQTALELTQKRVKAEIDVLKALKAQGKAIDEKSLESLERQYGETGDAINALPGVAAEETGRRFALAAPASASVRMRELADESRLALEKLNDPVEQLKTISESVSESIGSAFKGLITGATTAQEALANMFQSIADSFADMVAQMIAEWLKAQLIQGFQSLFSAVLPGLGAAAGGLSSGFSAGTSSAIDTGAAGWASSFATPLKFANGGIASGGFTAFANGGIVTGPTLGLVGEGRYNEAVIPLPDGKSVPVELGGAMGNQITSNIVVNVSSDGKTSSSGAGSDSAGLGRKLEGAVKQVIVDELRPGGLLSGRR